MRFHWGLGSKAKGLFVSAQVTKKAVNGQIQVGKLEHGVGFRSPDYGSKEETFFDSQAWLDSDCEDDFFSVNGDFTPSRGSTPNYQFGTAATPRSKGDFSDTFPDTKSEPSPTEKKKKLVDLLQESLQSEQQVSNEHHIADEMSDFTTKQEAYKYNGEHPLKSANGTPYFSGTNSVCNGGTNTPVSDPKHKKEKKTTNCCLPSLVPSLSFNDRKRQKASPEHGCG